MPQFQYQGVDKQGKKVSGKLDAKNELELRMVLRGQGVRPVRIAKASALNTDLGSLLRGGAIGTIGLEPLSVFTRQLQVLISSGIPLVQSLEVLTDQTPDPKIKRVFMSVKEKVATGAFLWESLNDYGRAFPRVYVALIRAAESSGAMEAVLDRLSKYLETTNKLNKMVKSAMIYPSMVILVGVGVIFGMLTFVIPKFEDLLKSSNQELPAITQIVIDSSHFMVSNFLYIVAGLGGFSYILVKYFSSDEGRGVGHRLLFQFPIMGPIMQKSGVARFTRTMGTLLSSGVNLIDAFDICKSTIDNAVLEDAVGKIRKEIETGKSLGQILNNIPVFPKMATQMIGVGESTGNMEKMLEKIADIYEGDVETLVGGLSKLIEPIILVVLGGIVAGLMLAMYMPIFKIAGSAT